MSGKVVGITDGDTISVMQDGRAVTVRLDAIDCPENAQDFSQRAKQFTSKMVFVRGVDVRDIDHYGRLVAQVFVDGIQEPALIVRQQRSRQRIQLRP